MTRYKTAWVSPEPNGGWPVAAYATVTPQTKMSAAGPGRPLICSGAMKPGRADHHARPGHGRGVQGLGDAEVDDLRAGVGEDDVGGLEVPVHDAGRVDHGQRLGQPGGQAVEHVGAEQPVAVDVLGQRRALGVLGDHERLRRLGVGLDHPDRADALDPHQRGHLAAETAPEIRVIGQFRAQHLDRHLAAVPADAEVHHAHAARAQPGGQPVMADPRRIASP